MKKNLIWIIAGAAVLFLAAIAVYLYSSGVIKPKAEGEAVTLSLIPSTQTYNVDDVFDLDVQLNTAGVVVEGVDLKNLSFDPQILDVQDADAATDGTQILVKSSVLTQVSLNSADQTNGTIALSIAAPADTPGLNGTETIASVSFKAKSAADATNVNFDFQVGDTTDTNVMSGGIDVLAVVTNGAYTIQAPTPLPTVNLKANDSDGPIEIESGTAATLSWTATPEGATCTASGGWSGAKSLTGTESTGNLTQAKTFTLTCVNVTGQASDSVTVNIKSAPPLPDVTVRVDGKKQVTIASGDSVTLTWTSTNATTCAASGSWSGAQATSGSVTIGPFTQAKAYTLTCSNDVGSVHDKALVYIENQPPPVIPTVDIKANDSDDSIAIDYNTAATLSWTSTNADSCTASNDWEGGKSTSGTESTGNLTESKTFTLTCDKGENNAVDSVTVNVNGQPAADPGPSDGNQISEDSAAQAGTISQPTGDSGAASKTPTTTEPSKKTAAYYKGGVIKPWTLWVFYAIIPLSIAGGVVFFFIRRKRQREKPLSTDELKNLPGDWPKS